MNTPPCVGRVADLHPGGPTPSGRGFPLPEMYQRAPVRCWTPKFGPGTKLCRVCQGWWRKIGPYRVLARAGGAERRRSLVSRSVGHVLSERLAGRRVEEELGVGVLLIEVEQVVQAPGDGVERIGDPR